MLRKIRLFRQYMKTDDFKNKAYKTTILFLAATSVAQIALWNYMPNFGEKGGETDEG